MESLVEIARKLLGASGPFSCEDQQRVMSLVNLDDPLPQTPVP